MQLASQAATTKSRHQPSELRVAVVRMEGAWRIFLGSERFGRFAVHDDALECALDIAGETRTEGVPVELLDQSEFGEVLRVADH